MKYTLMLLALWSAPRLFASPAAQSPTPPPKLPVAAPVLRPRTERIAFKNLHCVDTYKEAYELASQAKTKLFLTFETDASPELEEISFLETSVAQFGVCARLKIERDAEVHALFVKLNKRPGVAILDFTRESTGTVAAIAPFQRIPPQFVNNWIVLGEGLMEREILREYLRANYSVGGIDFNVEWSPTAEAIAKRGGDVMGAVRELNRFGYEGLATEATAPTLVEALGRLALSDPREVWVQNMKRDRRIQWGAFQRGGQWLVVFLNPRPDIR